MDLAKLPTTGLVKSDCFWLVVVVKFGSIQFWLMAMDWKIVISVFVPAVVAIVGWFVVSRINARSDLANRRRELIVSYLIDAYRQLEKSSCRASSKESRVAVELAVADIQLFGSSRQVELAQKFSYEISHNQTSSLTELLEELRQSLRCELELAQVKSKIIHLRFDRDPWLER